MTAGKSAPRRLILLTQWFDPEPTMKGLAFAHAMAGHGFEVEVVTGFPNYPGGKLYPGYRIRPIRREMHGAVKVTRLALYPSHDASKRGRVLNYLSFFLSAFFYLTFVSRRADVIYAYHPPLTTGMAAACAGWLRRTGFVLDIQDLWPDTLRATGMIGNERLLRRIGKFCAWTYRRASQIVVLSNGFRDLLVARGVSADKIKVIPNWADGAGEPTGQSDRSALLGKAGPFRVLFAGNMGLAQDLDTVLDAASLLLAKRGADVPPDIPPVEICLLGSGLDTERLRTRCTDEGIGNVRFLPRVPLAEAASYLRSADALLVHLRDDPLFAITIPSKTQAYLAAGRPIIMAVRGDAAEMVQAAKAGVTVAPGDAASLAEAMLGLARLPEEARRNMGRNGRDYYEHNLSMAVGTAKFAAILRNIKRR
jgi:colanic acid biosynthesis glycosyl transferase WcaI